MKVFRLIARILLGLVFTVFGANGFLHFIPTPPPPGPGGQFMGALFMTHELAVIMALQLVCGVLLLAKQYVPLAVALIAPVVVNILLFHAFMAPAGMPLALLIASLWAITFYGVKDAYAPLFRRELA